MHLFHKKFSLVDELQELNDFFAEGFQSNHSVKQLLQGDYLESLGRHPSRHNLAHVWVIRSHLVILQLPVGLSQNLLVDHFDGVVAFASHRWRHLEQLIVVKVRLLHFVVADLAQQMLRLLIMHHVLSLPLVPVVGMSHNQLLVKIGFFPVYVLKWHPAGHLCFFECLLMFVRQYFIRGKVTLRI